MTIALSFFGPITSCRAKDAESIRPFIGAVPHPEPEYESLKFSIPTFRTNTSIKFRSIKKRTEKTEMNKMERFNEVLLDVVLVGGLVAIARIACTIFGVDLSLTSEISKLQASFQNYKLPESLMLAAIDEDYISQDNACQQLNVEFRDIKARAQSYGLSLDLYRSFLRKRSLYLDALVLENLLKWKGMFLTHFSALNTTESSRIPAVTSFLQKVLDVMTAELIPLNDRQDITPLKAELDMKKKYNEF